MEVTLSSWLLITILSVSTLFWVVAIWKGLFSLPQGALASPSMSWISPFIAFLVYISIGGFIPRLVHRFCTNFSLPKGDIALFLLATALCSLLVLVGFVRIHKESVQQKIWGGGQPLGALLRGFLYGLCTFPTFMLLVRLVHLIVDQFGVFPRGEQVAVTLLRHLRDMPLLFWITVVAIVTLIPLVEELLFRGFLQTFFVDILGPRIGITLASLFFALFHYSAAQKFANIELLVGLFFVSYFIGIIYIRQKSLFAAIGFHAAFNAASLALFLSAVT